MKDASDFFTYKHTHVLKVSNVRNSASLLYPLASSSGEFEAKVEAEAAEGTAMALIYVA